MLHIMGSLPGAAQAPSCSTRACFQPSATQALTAWMRVPSAVTAQTGLRTSGQCGPFGTGAPAALTAAASTIVIARFIALPIAPFWKRTESIQYTVLAGLVPAIDTHGLFEDYGWPPQGPR